MITHHRSASPFESRYGFSRAVRHGPWVAVAGTAPIEADGTSTPGDAAAQAERCFRLARESLEALGARAGEVLRTRMYITHPEDADAVGRVHGAYFGEAAPAATMVVVQGLLRPEWRVEIEVEAWSPSGASD